MRIPFSLVLFLLFTVFTLAEIKLIFVLAHATSWPFTILVAIATGLLGSAMIKREGLSVLRRGRDELASGKFPAEPLAEGAVIIVGGAFLITPGLITDLLGLSTLVPPVRRFYARLIIRWARKKFTGRASGGARPGGFFFRTFTAGGQGPAAHARPDVMDAPEGSYRSEARNPDAVDVEFKRVD